MILFDHHNFPFRIVEYTGFHMTRPVNAKALDENNVLYPRENNPNYKWFVTRKIYTDVKENYDIINHYHII